MVKLREEIEDAIRPYKNEPLTVVRQAFIIDAVKRIMQKHVGNSQSQFEIYFTTAGELGINMYIRS